MSEEPKIQLGEKLGRAFLASLITFFMFAFLTGVSNNKRVSPLVGNLAVAVIAAISLLVCLASVIAARAFGWPLRTLGDFGSALHF